MATPEEQGKSLGRSSGFHPIHHQFTEKSPRGLVIKEKWERDYDLIFIKLSFVPIIQKRIRNSLEKVVNIETLKLMGQWLRAQGLQSSNPGSKSQLEHS